MTVTERGIKIHSFLVTTIVKTLGNWRENSSDRDHMHQLRYQHSVRARVLRPLRRKGSDGCTRDYWSRITQEQLGPTGCEIHTSTIHRATANWDWQNFLVIEIIERPTYRHINFHPKEFLTGVSESADSFPGYRSDVKINATTESKTISNMPDNQKINKIPLKDEFSPRTIIRTSKRMHWAVNKRALWKRENTWSMADQLSRGICAMISWSRQYFAKLYF